MECLNEIYAPISVCTIYLINIPEPVQYHIYAMAFPFGMRCDSVTCNSYGMGMRDVPDIYT